MVRTSAVAAAALGLLLSACTGPGDRAAGPEATATASPAQGETDPGDGAPSPEESPGEPAFEAGEAILNVAIQEPATLDPMLLGDPGSMLVARQLYEGLTAWDPERREVVPAAAASWDVSDGGRRFVFHLRDGITFHDGTPVKASDFEYAFDRIAQRRNASDLAYTLERVEGFDAVNRFGDRKDLRGIRAPNDDTLVVELSAPYYEFPAVLTHPGLVPLRRETVQDLDSFLRKPIGNGPFRIAKPWQSGDSIALEAFDGFYARPELDGIRFVPFDEAAQSWISFDEGDIHVAEVPVGQVQTAADAYGTRGYVDFLTGYYYAFNLDSGSLGKARVRKAVSLAIDRNRVAERVYRGNLEPIDGIVPPGMPGFAGNRCEEPCEPDKGAARRIVARLPKKARTISLDFTRGRPHAQVASSIARDLRRVGFRVRTRSYGFVKYVRRLTARQQGFYRLGWIAEFPSPDVFLGALFASGSPDNHTGFRSRRVDALLARAHRERDPSRRIRLYRAAERAIVRAHVVVPIGAFVNRWAARPEVRDIRFDAMGGFDAAGVSLDQGG